MQRHVIINTIVWNREALEHAQRDRHSTNPARAIAACRDARRYAGNIAQLEEKLND